MIKLATKMDHRPREEEKQHLKQLHGMANTLAISIALYGNLSSIAVEQVDMLVGRA